MEKWHEQLVLLFSIPIYAILIPLEILLSHVHHLNRYSWKETLMNIYLNLVAAGFDLLLRGVALFVLVFFAQYKLPIDWQNPIIYWVALFLLEDFLFWVEHFVDHHVRLFWAVHVTHHNSEEYNLTTGFRSSVLMPFYRFLYFIPLALMGFRPVDILFTYAITQIYGILVHTKSIKKVPKIISYLFVTPSHHRVHHASNVRYLDKNMGMVLIIWDRIFGTFQEELPEDEPKYGITHSLGDAQHHPIKIITHEWVDLFKDVKRASSWHDKLQYFIKPPGWKHDGPSLTTKQLQEQLKQEELYQKTIQ